MPSAAVVGPGQPPWLFSRRADFWLACGGASSALLLPALFLLFRGDHQLGTVDFVLGELHLGATYGAIVRRRLWRDRPADVLLAPVLILGLTYALSLGGQALVITSIAMYAAVWHRGRQGLGVARFYQRAMGGPVSPAHERLFRGAIYLPMLAATLLYTHLASADHEGEPYVALDLGAPVTSAVGVVAACWVTAYLVWALRRGGGALPAGQPRGRVHPGEWWVVLAHAVAFGSGYALGAANASFILVLAVHHEVQYLAYTYAMSRRAGTTPAVDSSGVAAFLVWPVVGLAGAVAGSWLDLDWLAPLGMGGLFCHYWLDARIWTRRQVAA